MATIQFTISNIDLEDFLAKRTILKMSLGIILVFDLGKPETFQNLKEHMNEITDNAGFIPILLMGTNLDAENEVGVQIPSLEIDQFMYKYGINHYVRVSTKTGEGIQQTFEIMSDEIIKETIRKLGLDDIKRRIAFSFALAMIGDKSIRKDWISEFGVQRFAAPPTMSGAISRKTLDRDIHHLIPEPLMDKISPISPPSPQPSPMLGAAPAGPGKTDDDRKKVREELFEKLAKTKGTEEKIEIKELEEVDDLEGIGTFVHPVSKLEEKPPVKEEKALEKPKPLQPMDFSKLDEEEHVELSEDLKANLDEELYELRKTFEDEVPKKLSGPPSPPKGPPSEQAAALAPSLSAAPLPPPPPKEEPPTPPASIPITMEAMRSEEEEVKAKKKAKIARRERKSMEMAEMAMDKSAYAPTPKPVTSGEMAARAVRDEFEEEKEGMYEEEVGAAPEMEVTTEKLLRKTTVFYRERMNPETLNKLAVVLSSEKIYEKLKIKIEEVARAATDKRLEIDKELPIVDVVPEFPGCVCVPSIQHLNAEKEYDIASFLITPLQAGEIPDAKVKLYHKGVLIETIPTPTKVVKTTSAKISAGMAIIVPLLSQFPLISEPIGNFLSGFIPFYNTIGGIEGIFLILTALFAGLSGLLFLFKRPKDAKPIETFPELDETLSGNHRY